MKNYVQRFALTGVCSGQGRGRAHAISIAGDGLARDRNLFLTRARVRTPLSTTRPSPIKQFNRRRYWYYLRILAYLVVHDSG